MIEVPIIVTRAVAIRNFIYSANVPRQRHPAVGATDAREAGSASGVTAGGCSLHESVRFIALWRFLFKRWGSIQTVWIE